MRARRAFLGGRCPNRGTQRRSQKCTQVYRQARLVLYSDGGTSEEGRLRRLLQSVVMVVGVACLSCSTPGTFVDHRRPAWINVTLNPGTDTESAWRNLVDFFKERFQLTEMDEKKYLQTQWSYDWYGIEDRTYRVRARVEYLTKTNSFRILPEAQSKKGLAGWEPGFDSVFREMLESEVNAILQKKT